MSTETKPLTTADLQRFDLLEREGLQRVFLCEEVNDDKEKCVRYRVIFPMKREYVAVLERWNEWLEKATLIRRLPKEFC